mmetsp:Transcript_10149/g.23769  ORF Transcript_10149/g.23769 Transcript_10149/m.23769 type:complete len:374 (+) Transcript_10149:5-1126(+)
MWSLRDDMLAFSKIVVAGGGVVGNSIAYFLAKEHGVACTIVDPIGIAPAASGKAGGFLARDWSDGSPIQELQRRSFDLHAEIAEHLGPEIIDYRRLECVAVAVDGSSAKKPGGKKLEGLEWADIGAVGSRPMGGPDTIAQVHPKKLCETMFRFSQEAAGSKLVVGKVVGADVDGGEVTGVRLEDGTRLDADALVVACGPWSDAARNWFGQEISLPSFGGIKYHSILVRSPRVLSQAVFFQGHGDPEVYPRPDGDAYITGFPDGPLFSMKETPGEEEVRAEKIDQLVDATEKTSSELGGIKPHTVQSCYLPTTTDGLPVIGPIAGVEGGFIASGHGCWGILNSPATGQAMAELLVKGKSSHLDLRLLGLDSPYR